MALNFVADVSAQGGPAVALKARLMKTFQLFLKDGQMELDFPYKVPVGDQDHG